MAASHKGKGQKVQHGYSWISIDGTSLHWNRAKEQFLERSPSLAGAPSDPSGRSSKQNNPVHSKNG